MEVLKNKAHLLIQGSMPKPENLGKPFGGNPFRDKGSFKNEHLIFDRLTKNEWVQFGLLVEMCGIAEVTVKAKVKSMDNLVGYKLHHHEETDSYILTASGE